jgi:5-methylcytosine-specific restriction endonuclease McrA
MASKTEKLTNTQVKRARSRHQPTGRWITVHKRLAIYLRDGFHCLACKKDLHGVSPAAITLDHISPRSHGGTNHESNIYTCCHECNSKRGNLPIAEFVKESRLEHINRNRFLDLKPFVVLAKAIIADRTGNARVENK